MIKALKYRIESYLLLRAQRACAFELQCIFDARQQLAQQERFLTRHAQTLAIEEVQLNVAARRLAGERAAW